MFRRYEMARIIKNKALIVLLVMFLLIGVTFLLGGMEAYKNRSEYKELKVISFDRRYDLALQDKIYWLEGREKEKESVLQQRENVDRAMEALDEGDFLTAYKYELINSIIRLDYSVEGNFKAGMEEETRPIWEDITDLDYPSNGQIEYISEFQLPQELLRIRSLYKSYKEGIEYITYDNINQNIVLYNIMDKLIPIFLIVFIIILSSDAISKEYRERTARNILSQPINRSKYFKDILISNYLVILMALILISFLVVIFAGFMTDFHSLKTPIVTTDNQWNSFKIMGMNLKRADLKVNFLSEGDLFYEGMVGLEGGYYLYKIYPTMKFIPFYQFILIYLLEISLFTLFMVSLTIFISSLNSRKSWSMGIVSLSTAGLYFLMEFFPSVPNPMLAINTRSIISGLSDYTLLTLTLTQLVSILLVWTIGLVVFNRKEVKY